MFLVENADSFHRFWNSFTRQRVSNHDGDLQFFCAVWVELIESAGRSGW